jgi:hypothetical protein
MSDTPKTTRVYIEMHGAAVERVLLDQAPIGGRVQLAVLVIGEMDAAAVSWLTKNATSTRGTRMQKPVRISIDG